MKEQRFPILKKAFMTSLPVLAGYVVLGAGFVMVLKAKGYGVIWAAAMSVFIYAGSMQFVATDLLAGGAGLLTAALTTLLVNARHLFYGISMIDRYKNTGKSKPYLIFGLTDETYSLLVSDDQSLPKKERTRYYLLVSALNQSYWITGSLLGSILGTLLDFNTAGIDFSLTALFLTIVVDQWRGGKHHLSTVLGLLASVACLLVFGPDQFLIPSMILILAMMFGIRKREEVLHE